MSQNTKQYASIEQALEMVREYMKEKQLQEFYGNDGQEEWMEFTDEYISYVLKQGDFEIVFLTCTSIELSHRLCWLIPMPESKEDFLSLMRLLDV